MELSMGVTVRFDEAASACDPAETQFHHPHAAAGGVDRGGE
jgi:hypothetical protein